MIDLREVFAGIANQNMNKGIDSDTSGSINKTESSDPNLPSHTVICIVLATDGVWDNWTYEDVTKFVMDSSCLTAVNSGSDGADRVAKAFMQRNAVYARRNFGSQADNATGIVAYISNVGTLPH